MAVEATVETFIFLVVKAEDGVDIFRVGVVVLIVLVACLVLLEHGAHNLLLNLAHTTSLAQRQTQCWCKTLCVLTNLAQRQTK